MQSTIDALQAEIEELKEELAKAQAEVDTLNENANENEGYLPILDAALYKLADLGVITNTPHAIHLYRTGQKEIPR